MSRLLFAAARGARIGWEHAGEWYSAMSMCIGPSKADNGTIHPDDEHLQYGPISTALREMAEHNRSDIRPSWEMGLSNFAANEFTQYFDSRQGEPDYPLFYLFLAEFLADSGL
jgi:hypothetical protein